MADGVPPPPPPASAAADVPLHPDDPPSLAPLCACVRTLIAGVGEDAAREGLVDTPKRVAKAWLDMTAGYKADIDSILNGALFHEPLVGSAPGLAGLVLVRDVEFASTSEADLAPFYGRLHIAYVPGESGVVLGLSKVARLAKVLARRLTHQAALADAVLAAFVAAVRPRGAAVFVEARAVGRPGAAAAPGGPGLVVTTAASGCIADGRGGGPCVTEVLSLLRLRGASAGGTAPLPASASVGRGGSGSGSSGSGGGVAALPPRPSPRPVADRAKPAPTAAPAAPASAPPTTPGPSTPDRGPGGGEDGDGDDELEEEEEEASCTYVHAGEVLWANGHGGAGGALHERRCSGGSAGGGGGGVASPSPPPPAPALLPRPPSAAADLHLRGRGESHHAAAAAACCGGETPAAGPPPPAASLEPCPARRGSVPPSTREAMVRAVRDMLSLAGEDPSRPGLRGAAGRYVDGLLASTAGYDADVAGVVAAAAAARAARAGGGGGHQASPAPPPPPPPPHPPRPPSPALLAPGGAASSLLPPSPSVLPAPSVDVAVRFTSMCEHHMLPFHGVARVVCLVGGEEEGGGRPRGHGGGEGGGGGGGARALDAATVSALVRAFALRLQVQERLTQQVADAVHAAAGAPARGTLVVLEAAHMCMVARGVEQHGSATVTVGARGGLADGGRERRELLARLAAG